MTAISNENAELLYEILDETIGVFRQVEMSEGAVKFYEEKKKEFIDTYTEEIPDSFWFQGFECPSVSLDFNSTGFNVKLMSDKTTQNVKTINTANERIDEAKIHVIG